MLLHTKRIDMHPLTIGWTDEIYAHNTGNVKKYFYDFKLLKQAKLWVESTVKEIKNGSKSEYVLTTRDNNFIGMISVRLMAEESDIGLWIAESQQKKGYAKEALQCVIDEIFKNSHIKTITYLTEPNNASSVGLARSLGFKKLPNEILEGIPHYKFVKYR